MIRDGEHHFCCKGCQQVFHLLHDQGLTSFYEKLGDQTLHPPSDSASGEDLEHFDSEGFLRRYVRKRPDGLLEVSLILEGIHCAACVWLNEKVLHRLPGVVEATINYSTNKAKVVWDPHSIKLSRIVEAIRSIGYDAHAYDPSLQEERALQARRDYYARILVAVFATMNIMWIAIAQYVGLFTGMKPEYKQILNVAEFVLATPTLFYSGWIFFKGAYYGLKNRFVNMDLLIATGATIVYLYSIWAMVTNKGEVYFDSVTMIITFVLVGKYLEVLSKKQAVDTIDRLLGSYPTQVRVIDTQGQGRLVPVEQVEVGKIVELKPGEKVVIDGRIVEGAGSFDESSLTGEALPVYKEVGDEVVSGSICLDSLVRYRVERPFRESMMSQIARLLEESLNKRPKIEALANELSGFFSLIILTIALLTFGGWYYVTGSLEEALVVAVSVVVIACPCALGLATPMATLVGIGEAAKRGILFKEAAYLETMAKADTLVLDKTGTLTRGEPAVVAEERFAPFDPALIAAVVTRSNHPISRGIAAYLRVKNPPVPSHFVEIKAKGIEAVVNGHQIVAGSVAFLQERGISIEYRGEHTVFAVAIDGRLVALFELDDPLREGAGEAIVKIKELGLAVVMLTGDSPQVARRIASILGIEYRAGLLPQEKAAFIDDLHAKGHIVIMAGDGINDSLALARSDIAIAMGSGADIALSVSDVILLEERPMKLYEAIRLSQRVYRIIKENLALSLIYNTIALPLAILGYVNPLVAALAMSLSSLAVVGNSMRIKGGLK